MQASGRPPSRRCAGYGQGIAGTRAIAAKVLVFSFRLADSGDLASDLSDLLVAVGKAAKEIGTAVLVAIDEVQYLNETEFSALIVAIHRISQLQLPLVVIATGLPQVPGLAGDAKSYAERLFEFPVIGALSDADAREAIATPARRARPSARTLTR